MAVMVLLVFLYLAFQFLYGAVYHLLQLVGRDAYGLVDVLQRPFHYRVVLRAADEQSDAGIVALATQQLVGGSDIEVELAGKLRG